MTLRILGISAFYHDSAACLVEDGNIVAAAQEERFTRKKHDADFPQHAVEYCLEAGRIKPSELDYVGFYDKPLLKFERILENYLGVAPKGLGSFMGEGETVHTRVDSSRAGRVRRTSSFCRTP
jgi:carbamoyltransferase